MNNQQKEEQLKLLILENKVSEIKNLISSNIDLISYIQINLNDILLITQDNNSEKLLSYILKTFLHDSMAKIDSAMNHAIINSNGFWLNNFFNLLPHCVDKTTFQLPNIWQNIDLENLAKSKPNTFNVVVYHSLKNGFQLYPHLLSKELIENNKIHRLKTYLNKLTENAKTLNKNDPIPYSNIISSSLQQGKINFLNEFLNTYNYKLSLFNNEFIRSAYESVGFAGNIKSLNYINALFSHDLTNNKNKNNTHLIDAALRTNKIEFINYCFSQGARFYQTFYQTNIINQNYCTALRRTAWEDLTLRDKPHQAQLVLTLKNLIAKYEPENLNQFIDEIKKSPAPELFEFIDKENFYNELNSTLLSKNNTNQQNTHKIKL